MKISKRLAVLAFALLSTSIAQAVPILIGDTVDYDRVIVQADGTEVEVWSQSAIVADDPSSPEFSEGAVPFFVFDIGPTSIRFETNTEQCCASMLGNFGGFNGALDLPRFRRRLVTWD